MRTIGRRIGRNIVRTLGGAALAAMLACAAGPFAMSSAQAGDLLTTQDRVALQTTMAEYIEQHMVGDAFLHVDPKTGTVEKLYPVTQHPMIVRLDKVLVLCADLRSGDGKTVNADFYATQEGGKYVIFQTEIGNREPLQALLMKGAASLLE